MLLDNWLAQRAETCPDRAALIAGDRTIDYATLEAEAVSAARRLAGKGVRRDSVVAITMPAGIEFAVALHALMKLGAVAAPLDRRLGEAERRRVLGDGQSALTLSSPEDLEGAEADLPLLGEIDLDATCTRVLTSGTAGSPRPVPLTYGNHLERGRLGLQPRGGPGRPLALLRAGLACLGSLDPVALGHLRHHHGRPRRIRRRPGRRVAAA